MTPCPGWELPDPQVLGPLRHIVALAANIGRPTIMVTADLLHKERDVQIRAFVPQGPDPPCLHATSTRARFAPADDPVRNASARLKLQVVQRTKGWLEVEAAGRSDRCAMRDPGSCRVPLS